MEVRAIGSTGWYVTHVAKGLFNGFEMRHEIDGHLRDVNGRWDSIVVWRLGLQMLLPSGETYWPCLNDRAIPLAVLLVVGFAPVRPFLIEPLEEVK